ncbi:MAG: cell division protein ZapA [Rhodobacteraceae bacterium]|nr:cell division protein ZapA [Paracoccaceae bacterium]
MPESEITIGGRRFSVACQEGQEPALEAAVRMLDTEAAVILDQIERMPTERMLLLAGLMLADKIAALEGDVARVQDELVTAQSALAAAQGKLDDRARRIAELEEAAPPAQVAVIPTRVTDGLAELATRAEALADTLEGHPAG